MTDTRTAERVWETWERLPFAERKPVAAIASALRLTTAEVAGILLPGLAWEDSMEPIPHPRPSSAMTESDRRYELYGLTSSLEQAQADAREETGLAGLERTRRLLHLTGQLPPHAPLTRSPSLDRFRGLMIGTAVGDSLGRPVEGHRRVSVDYVAEVITNPPPMRLTDDTAMTIGLAESLLAADGFSGDDLAQRFAENYRSDPDRGYGGGAIKVFKEVLRGMPWQKAAGSLFGGTGSYGNGAAMRVAPVALWSFGDLGSTIRLAEETAKITHTHPEGIEGAVLQAAAAWHALHSDANGKLDLDGILSDLKHLAHTDEFTQALEILPLCLDRDDEERTRLHLGNGVRASRSVITALHCFLKATAFEEAIVRALQMGGDVDTIAAMTGALAGARFGLAGIPEAWQQVEGRAQLLALADAIYARRA
ncbi:MAG: ADP-ribosylglycohydrolase family protein [Acidimicrobiia bacterium]